MPSIESVKVRIEIEVIPRDDEYGVRIAFGNQSFALDYTADRESAEWMADRVAGALGGD